MRKNHIFGAILVLAGVLMINHFFLVHEIHNVYPPTLLIPIFIAIVSGFGIMLDLMRIKNV